MGVNDREVLKTVREDVGRQRYHIACNRVFEFAHKDELKKVSVPHSQLIENEIAKHSISQVKDEGLWNAADLDTILHPNTYFKRSFMLKNLSRIQSGDIGMENAS